MAVSGVLDSNEESGAAVAELPTHRVAALLAVIDRTRVLPDLPARLIAATPRSTGALDHSPAFAENG